MTDQRELLDDDWELDEPDDGGRDELPPRPRRRLLTPAAGVFVAVLLVAGGFIAGVEVQKSQGSTSTPTTAATGRAAAFAGRGGFGGFGGGGPGAGAGAGAPTAGQVANKRGSTLYVTTSGGATVKVRTNAGSRLTRTATTSARGIYPGDTVIVTGTKRSDGSIVATRVTATAKGTSAFGGFGGGFGRFGGGQP